MKLTRKKAIAISVELWEWLAESGGYKQKWPKWKEYGRMFNDCPLCEYVIQEMGNHYSCAEVCPLNMAESEGCTRTSYGEWRLAAITEDRKRYATEFLAVLRGLK